jgi:hypothetical protein
MVCAEAKWLACLRCTPKENAAVLPHAFFQGVKRIFMASSCQSPKLSSLNYNLKDAMICTVLFIDREAG